MRATLEQLPGLGLTGGDRTAFLLSPGDDSNLTSLIVALRSQMMPPRSLGKLIISRVKTKQWDTRGGREVVF